MARGFWPPGFRSLNNVKRWRGSRPGGLLGGGSEMKRRGRHPKHERITHADASLINTLLTVRAECAYDPKSQDGPGTIVGVLALGYPAYLPCLVS